MRHDPIFPRRPAEEEADAPQQTVCFRTVRQTNFSIFSLSFFLFLSPTLSVLSLQLTLLLLQNRSARFLFIDVMKRNALFLPTLASVIFHHPGPSWERQRQSETHSSLDRHLIGTGLSVSRWTDTDTQIIYAWKRENLSKTSAWSKSRTAHGGSLAATSGKGWHFSLPRKSF